MQWLASICVRRPVFATVLILIIVVVGIVGYRQLGVDRFPKVDFPIVSVDHDAAGRGARGGRDRGHRQDRGGGQHHQRHRRAALDLDRGRVAGHRQLRARQGRRRRRAGGARHVSARSCPTCPRGSSARSSASSIPTPRRCCSSRWSRRGPIREVTELADHEVRQALESITGVGQVDHRRRPQAPDPGRGSIRVKLRAAGLSAPSTSSAPSSRRTSPRPAARSTPGPQRLTFRVQRPRASVEAIGDIVVRSVDGHPIRVRDVGTRRRRRGGGRDRRQHRRQAGGRALGPQAVGHEHRRGRRRASRERMKELEPTLPRRLQARASSATTPRPSAPASTPSRSTWSLGALLAALVVLLFLGNVRSTLIAALAIPTSIIGTFALMWLAGLHAQHHHAAGAGAGGRHRHRRRHRRAREHLPLHRGEEDAAVAGRDRRHQGDRPGGARDHAVADGGVPAGRVHAAASSAASCSSFGLTMAFAIASRCSSASR